MKNGTSSKPTKICPSLRSAATSPCNCGPLVIPLCQNQGTEFQPRGMRLVADALKPVLSIDWLVHTSVERHFRTSFGLPSDEFPQS